MAARIKQPDLKNFFRAFGSRWFTLMCGPLTVPFVVAGVLVPVTWQKALLFALAGLCGVFSSYWVWRVERQEKNEELARGLPRLRILWNPKEHGYEHRFQVNGENVLSRVKVVNCSHTHPVSGVQVRMEDLNPSTCPCIPACLRLMNDNPSTPDQPFVERFSLTAGGSQFVDVIQQNLNDPSHLYVWHVVSRSIDVRVPAQGYRFTIQATADNAPPVSEAFETYTEGMIWRIRPLDHVSPLRRSTGAETTD